MKSLTGQAETGGVATLHLTHLRDNGEAPESAEPRSACDGPRLLGSDPSDLTGRPSRMTDSFTPRPDAVQQARRTYSFDVAGWRTAAVRSSRLTTPTRLLLAIMADKMRTTDGLVSIPRKDLADYCGCSERQVSERLEEAVRERFLDRVSKGKRGHTAEYRGLRQTESGRHSLTLSPATEPRKREVTPDAFSGTDTAQPPAFPNGLSVEAKESERHSLPPVVELGQRTKPRRERVPVGITSALPSQAPENQGQEQRRDDGEPVALGEVFDLLFRRKAS